MMICEIGVAHYMWHGVWSCLTEALSRVLDLCSFRVMVSHTVNDGTIISIYSFRNPVCI